MGTIWRLSVAAALALAGLLVLPNGCGSDGSAPVGSDDGGDGASQEGGGFGDGGGGGDGANDGGGGTDGGGGGGGGGLCSAQGSACTKPTECCTVSCVGGKCGSQCVSDNKACTSDAQCCSGTCAAGTKTCTPLNTSCETAGNACTGNDQCCSKLCSNGFCALNSSFCVQNGDTCTKGADCCGGNCTIPSGKTVGTCSAVTGSTNCNGGQDGTVCAACTDCCSRLCAPYAPTGVMICQPANGCHVNGDLCRKDSDCCGGESPDSGVPGAGNVTCEIQPGNTVGICRNPQSCNPEGDVCHYQNYACSISSARNDCCDHLGSKTDCTLDDIGVPRCHVIGNPADGDAGIPCRDTNQACAFSGDCCNGAKCIPSGNGFVCGAAAPPDGGVACQPSGQVCSVTADCCSGYTCIVPPGGTNGTCGTVGTGTGSDAGVTDAGTLACAQYGQGCGGAVTCCNGVTCLSGVCHYQIN